MRIGVNWGSLDQELLTRLMDENATLAEPKDAREVMHEAIVQSALLSAARAMELGLGADKIVLSAKVSAVQDLIAVYAMLAARSDLALHLGLTEAGMGSKGIVASSAALGVLLQQGIGDTIRISLTPEPNGDRTLEVKVAQELLQSMGFRAFVPLVAACPGCGRTTSTTFQELARDIQDFIRESMPEWKRRYPGVETLTVAVMGCIVNGPGESKHADIGISLPGTGEAPAAPVFIDGKKVATLRGPGAAADFKQMVLDYIERRFGQANDRPQRRGVTNSNRAGPRLRGLVPKLAPAIGADLAVDRFARVGLVEEAALGAFVTVLGTVLILRQLLADLLLRAGSIAATEQGRSVGQGRGPKQRQQYFSPGRTVLIQGVRRRNTR